MIDKQPTQEQIKEVWEWCGWRYETPTCDCQSCKVLSWIAPDAVLLPNKFLAHSASPDIDLNNLFKYAVRKLHGITIVYPSVLFDEPTYEVRVWGTKKTTEPAVKWHKDLALALLRAIWEVIKDDNKT